MHREGAQQLEQVFAEGAAKGGREGSPAVGARNGHDAADALDHVVVHVARAIRIEQPTRIKGARRVPHQVNRVVVAGGRFDEDLPEPCRTSRDRRCWQGIDPNDLEIAPQPRQMRRKQLFDVTEVAEVAEVGEAEKAGDQENAGNHL